MAVEATDHRAELSGLDALEVPEKGSPGKIAKLRRGVVPKAGAIAIALFVWQLVVWSHWKPSYLLPGPVPVFRALGTQLHQGEFWKGLAITMKRAVEGYGIAIVIGLLIGAAVSRFQLLRSAVGSLITGLQTMPSIVWFPLAQLLFQLTDGAIVFVVVIGAAPSVANAVISGIDQIPPLLLRSGRMLGARGWKLYRHVILPAIQPNLVAGLKQGWAFAWRSLMAGELLVIVANEPSLGSRLEFARQLSDPPNLIALMIVILVIGILADSALSAADRAVRRRWGLLLTA